MLAPIALRVGDGPREQLVSGAGAFTRALGLRQQQSQEQKQKSAVAAAAAVTEVLEMYLERIRFGVSSGSSVLRGRWLRLNSCPFILITSRSRNIGRLPGRTSLSRTAVDW